MPQAMKRNFLLFGPGFCAYRPGTFCSIPHVRWFRCSVPLSRVEIAKRSLVSLVPSSARRYKVEQVHIVHYFLAVATWALASQSVGGRLRIAQAHIVHYLLAVAAWAIASQTVDGRSCIAPAHIFHYLLAVVAWALAPQLKAHHPLAARIRFCTGHSPVVLPQACRCPG